MKRTYTVSQKRKDDAIRRSNWKQRRETLQMIFNGMSYQSIGDEQGRTKQAVCDQWSAMENMTLKELKKHLGIGA